MTRGAELLPSICSSCRGQLKQVQLLQITRSVGLSSQVVDIRQEFASLLYGRRGLGEKARGLKAQPMRGRNATRNRQTCTIRSTSRADSALDQRTSARAGKLSSAMGRAEGGCCKTWPFSAVCVAMTAASDWFACSSWRGSQARRAHRAERLRRRLALGFGSAAR
jgi:hypothetical protein